MLNKLILSAVSEQGKECLEVVITHDYPHPLNEYLISYEIRFDSDLSLVQVMHVPSSTHAEYLASELDVNKEINRLLNKVKQDEPK
jgi:hypothetical protein